MIHIRLKTRKTPKGQIECPIGETVKPSFCKNCAYASHCTSYELYLLKKNNKHLKLREIYWKIRAWLSEWFEYIRYRWNNYRKESIEARLKPLPD